MVVEISWLGVAVGCFGSKEETGCERAEVSSRIKREGQEGVA